jgi:hypothetical protein
MAERQDSDGGESRRIIERIAREADSSGASFIARTAKGARDHLAAADADRCDPIEMWGTRIGRVLGLVLMAGLMIWLVSLVVRGG